MSGPRGHLGSKPTREIFLTSSSLSFSSLSSSYASSDNAIELNMKTSRTTCEDQKGKLMKASSRGSEMSCVTHVRMQPVPSPPSRLRPVQLMNKGLGLHYDPERIPASVFGKDKDLNWSDESLFSLRMSNFHAYRQSNLKPEDVLMSGEFLAYSPSLRFKPEDTEEKRSTQMNKKKSVVTSVETNSHREKSASSTLPTVSYPSSFAQLYQAPPRKDQSFPHPVAEKKSKKRKKTKKSKKKEKKEKKEKNKNKKNRCCCIWSWLFSRFYKCNCNLCCCYKWSKCG